MTKANFFVLWKLKCHDLVAFLKKVMWKILKTLIYGKKTNILVIWFR